MHGYRGSARLGGDADAPIRTGGKSTDGCLTKCCLFVIDRSVVGYCQKLNSTNASDSVVYPHNR